MKNMKNFWGENYYNNPTITKKDIEGAEKKLHVKLPEKFIELLKIQNGGYTKNAGFLFPMKIKTTWADDHIPLNQLYGIVINKDFDTGHNIMDSEYLIKEWGLPPNQVLITGDGHWWITLDYRKEKIPTIRWIDVECNEDIHVADNFEEFINGLVPYEEYE